MTTEITTLLTVALPTLAVLIGILTNNRQVDSLRGELGSVRNELGLLRSDINGRFDSFGKQMDARFEAAHQALLRVEGVLDARLQSLERERH